MVRKIWMFALLALLISLFTMHFNLIFSTIGLSFHQSSSILQEGWQLSDGQGVLARDLSFEKMGAIKDQHSWSITNELPPTDDDSLCFVSIGYRVEAFVDGKDIYRFGTALDKIDIWSVNTHMIPLPDGTGDRTLTLKFETSQPFNVALSSYILLDHDTEIIKALLKSNLVKVSFPILYIAIGIFLLIVAIQNTLLRKFYAPTWIMALIAIALGTRILFNISIIAYFTSPVVVYWMINLINVAIPLLILLYVWSDSSIADRWVLLVLAAVQALFLIVWTLATLSNYDLQLPGWNNYLFLLMTAILVVIFFREIRAGRKHLETVVSISILVIAVMVNGYFYNTYGVQNTMDFSVTILGFPILVLMSGRATFDVAQKEERMVMENTALKREGHLLLKNYNRIEHYMEETRKIWHDIDKHLAVLNKFGEDGKYDELKKYLKRIGFDTRQVKDNYLSENYLINAIFTDKISEAESYGIDCSVLIQVPKELRIASNDLCSLLINLMDNALEACRKGPDRSRRFINIKLWMKNDFFYVGMENSFAGEQVDSIQKDRVLESSESSGQINVHATRQKNMLAGKRTILGVNKQQGYGKGIIRSIAEKYDGAYESTQTADTYSVQVALRNAEKGTHGRG